MISREVKLSSDNIDLNGNLFLPGNNVSYPAVCICHGIPGGQLADPGDRGYAGLAEKVCNAGFAAFIFNFRGSRNSGGNFDILGWTNDLLVALDYLWLQPEIDRSKIALLGYSAGAAVSICVGSRDRNIAAVVSCGCPAEWNFINNNPEQLIEYFRSIGIIRDKNYPESAEDWMNNFKIVSPLYYVSGIAPRPFLVVHGDQDDLVNVDDALKLYEKAGEPKKLVIIKGAGHRLRLNGEAVDTVINWLRQTLK
jgi:uncharacterized protein